MRQTHSHDEDPNLVENWIDRFLQGWAAPSLPPADPDVFIMIVDDGDGGAGR